MSGEINATFVMEQHIGHRTYYENLRPFVEADSEINSTWIEVTYSLEQGIWPFLSWLPASLRGTLMGREQVRRGLSQTAFDLAVFNTQVPAALASGLVQRRPYILCTDITPLQFDRMGRHYGHKPERGGLLSRYKHRVNVQLFQRAAYLLPWSSWTANSLADEYGVDPGRIEVVPPGVDTAKWQPAVGTGDRPLRILFIGGDFYRKGGEILLKAFQHLPAGSAELIVVTRSVLEQSANVTVYNDMKPNSAEMVALCQSCHLFVLPTAAEAFGIAAVEASAVGLPVIATQVGGLIDVVADGETGFLIPSDDFAVLTARLNLLLSDNDLRLRMGHAARTRVETQFDARKNAGRLIEILKRSIVGKKSCIE